MVYGFVIFPDATYVPKKHHTLQNSACRPLRVFTQACQNNFEAVWNRFSMFTSKSVWHKQLDPTHLVMRVETGLTVTRKLQTWQLLWQPGWIRKLCLHFEFVPIRFPLARMHARIHAGTHAHKQLTVGRYACFWCSGGFFLTSLPCTVFSSHNNF